MPAIKGGRNAPDFCFKLFGIPFPKEPTEPTPPPTPGAPSNPSEGPGGRGWSPGAPSTPSEGPDRRGYTPEAPAPPPELPRGYNPDSGVTATDVGTRPEEHPDE